MVDFFIRVSLFLKKSKVHSITHLVNNFEVEVEERVNLRLEYANAEREVEIEKF